MTNNNCGWFGDGLSSCRILSGLSFEDLQFYYQLMIFEGVQWIRLREHLQEVLVLIPQRKNFPTGFLSNPGTKCLVGLVPWLVWPMNFMFSQYNRHHWKSWWVDPSNLGETRECDDMTHKSLTKGIIPYKFIHQNQNDIFSGSFLKWNRN